MIRQYILHRPNLYCIFVLIDSRLEPQKIDLEFLAWLGENGVPLAIIFTKADKQSQSKTKQNIENFENAMKETWEAVPDMFVTSSANKTGREDVLEYINKINEQAE